MNLAPIAAIANAVLYEGYLLWPYRASALKNQKRFTFGALAPAGASADHALSCELPIENDADAELELAVRFLQPIWRQIVDASGALLERARIDGVEHRAWDEALERTLAFGPFWPSELRDGLRLPFAFTGAVAEAPLAGGLRWQRQRRPVRGEAWLQARDGKLVVSVRNTTDTAGLVRGAELATFHAAHAALGVRGGAFLSLTEMSEPHRSKFRNTRFWPVLVGERREASSVSSPVAPAVARADQVLCSPIIMSDFPAVAGESAGDMFDATESDELLSLSVLGLAEGERREAEALDRRARALVERAHALDAAGQARLHGVIRERAPSVRAGTRVRLEPKKQSDVFDRALSGRTALVLSVEVDSNDRRFVTVAVDDDPGRDLAGRIGHRFFFLLDEVEPIGADE